MLKTLAIIPARGGSKGVKNKNIRTVAGEPLINYSIKCAMTGKIGVSSLANLLGLFKISHFCCLAIFLMGS